MTILAETLFQALSDSTRLRILVLIQSFGELCVCELAQATDIQQPKISRHLASLRESQIVKDRRQGVWIFYSINNDLSNWMQIILYIVAKSLENQKPFINDNKEILEMQNRPARCAS